MSSLFLTAKLHRAIGQVLQYVTAQKLPLDKSYALHFSQQQYTSEEHAKIIQVVGELTRKLNLYLYLIDINIDDMSEITQDDKNVDNILYAWCLVNQQKTPVFLQPSGADRELIEQRWSEAQAQQALLDGCPQWLDELGQEQLGERWASERAALALSAKRFIRENTLKISPKALKDVLKKENIDAQEVENITTALEVISNSALFKSQAFQQGLFEQQDAGSQCIVEALGVQPGMRVIDACAGAGGKSLGLAAQMQSKGRLLALDTEAYKLDTLKERAKRAGAHNIETREITSSKITKRLKESADRLLLDVPCTGLGVLRRNPDAKWREDLREKLPILMRLQQDILTRYSKMLKVDGIMVYATCSILPCENEQQIQTFLAAHSNFSLLEEKTISTAQTGFDGFYWAKLQRTAV